MNHKQQSQLNNRKMVQQQQGELNKALIEAAENGHVEVCLFLIEQGANINYIDELGRTPLHRAATNGHAEVCRLLLEQGTDVHATNWLGLTPLHMAAFNGHFEVCRLLLERGANVHAIARYDDTPLHDAAANGHLKVCRLLIEQGANVHVANWFGWTPLDLANGIHAVGVLVYFYVHGVVNFHQPDHTGQKPWDRLTAEQQGMLTKAMAEHQEKIGILQTRGLPIELARLVMSYV